MSYRHSAAQNQSNWRGSRARVDYDLLAMEALEFGLREKFLFLREVKRLRGEVSLLAKRNNNLQWQINTMVAMIRAQPPPKIPQKRPDEDNGKKKEEDVVVMKEVEEEREIDGDRMKIGEEEEDRSSDEDCYTETEDEYSECSFSGSEGISENEIEDMKRGAIEDIAELMKRREKMKEGPETERGNAKTIPPSSPTIPPPQSTLPPPTDACAKDKARSKTPTPPSNSKAQDNTMTAQISPVIRAPAETPAVKKAKKSKKEGGRLIITNGREIYDVYAKASGLKQTGEIIQWASEGQEGGAYAVVIRFPLCEIGEKGYMCRPATLEDTRKWKMYEQVWEKYFGPKEERGKGLG